MDKKNLIVFGTGNYYTKFKEILERKFNIVAFADNNIQKWNTYLDNIKIISPNKIQEYKYDKIFIASSYEMEIEKQLLDAGIEQQNIITSKTILNHWIKNGKINFNVNCKIREDDKINVMFCISELTGGGAQRVLIDLLNNLDYKKYSVDLVIVFNKGIYFDKINKNVRYITLFNNELEMLIGQNYIRRAKRDELYKLCITDLYDVEIAFLEGEATKIISGSNNIHSKKLAWVHTNIKNNHWTKKIYIDNNDEEETYKNFDYIIGDSKDVGQSVIDAFNINQEKIRVIHTIIEGESIKKLSIKENIKFNEFTFCAVGRLTKVKGIDRLIKAHKKLIDETIKHSVIVIGEGEEEKSLKGLAKELEVEDSFKFIGFQNNPYKYMKASDVFILPSLEEGLSTVICEALVLEKAIIATKCSGIIELLEDSRFGIVTENSEIGIYNSMKNVLLNTEAKKYYESMAKIRAKDFNNKDIINKIELLISSEGEYENIISSK